MLLDWSKTMTLEQSDSNKPLLLSADHPPFLLGCLKRKRVSTRDSRSDDLLVDE